MALVTAKHISSRMHREMALNDEKNRGDRKTHEIGHLRIMETYYESMMYLMRTRLGALGQVVPARYPDDENSLDGLDDDVDCMMFDDEEKPIISVLNGRKGYARVPPQPPVGVKRAPPDTPPPSPKKRVRKPKPPAAAPKAAPKKGKSRGDKGTSLEKADFLFDRLMASFRQPQSLITVTTDEYAEILPKIRKNLDLAVPGNRPSKSAVITYIRAFKKLEMVPHDITMRMFVEHIHNYKDTNNQADKMCKACSEHIDGLFAFSLKCDRTKMHPKCAAIVMDTVGIPAYHNCLVPMCTHNLDGSVLPKKIACRHTEYMASILEDRYLDALDLATTEYMS